MMHVLSLLPTSGRSFHFCFICAHQLRLIPESSLLTRHLNFFHLFPLTSTHWERASSKALVPSAAVHSNRQCATESAIAPPSTASPRSQRFSTQPTMAPLSRFEFRSIAGWNTAN
jgi:hypothetical protein